MAITVVSTPATTTYGQRVCHGSNCSAACAMMTISKTVQPTSCTTLSSVGNVGQPATEQPAQQHHRRRTGLRAGHRGQAEQERTEDGADDDRREPRRRATARM